MNEVVLFVDPKVFTDMTFRMRAARNRLEICQMDHKRSASDGSALCLQRAEREYEASVVAIRATYKLVWSRPDEDK